MKNGNMLFGKSDLLLLLCVLSLSLLLLLLSLLPKETGRYAAVKSGSETLGKYRLDENAEIPIKTEYGENILVIEDGCASIKEADCPDRLCVLQGKISEAGEIIVCLPHRISVTVTE